MTATEILKLIENVSPDDTDKLDEIDARVFGYIKNWDFVSVDGRAKYYKQKRWLQKIPQYTRSRDCLKAIRPDGWSFVLDIRAENYSVCFSLDCDNQTLSDWYTAQTEELAELHAIIQAIEWDRNNA